MYSSFGANDVCEVNSEVRGLSKFFEKFDNNPVYLFYVAKFSVAGCVAVSAVICNLSPFVSFLLACLYKYAEMCLFGPFYLCVSKCTQSQMSVFL